MVLKKYHPFHRCIPPDWISLLSCQSYNLVPTSQGKSDSPSGGSATITTTDQPLSETGAAQIKWAVIGYIPHILQQTQTE